MNENLKQVYLPKYFLLNKSKMYFVGNKNLKQNYNDFLETIAKYLI